MLLYIYVCVCVGEGIVFYIFTLTRINIVAAHYYVASRSDAIDSERAIDFYDIAQFDGLSRVEMDSLHLTQHYIDRDDFLYYR